MNPFAKIVAAVLVPVFTAGCSGYKSIEPSQEAKAFFKMNHGFEAQSKDQLTKYTIDKDGGVQVLIYELITCGNTTYGFLVKRITDVDNDKKADRLEFMSSSLSDVDCYNRSGLNALTNPLDRKIEKRTKDGKIVYQGNVDLTPEQIKEKLDKASKVMQRTARDLNVKQKLENSI
jgi:hypothetical protein